MTDQLTIAVELAQVTPAHMLIFSNAGDNRWFASAIGPCCVSRVHRYFDDTVYQVQSKEYKLILRSNADKYGRAPSDTAWVCTECYTLFEDHP